MTRLPGHVRRRWVRLALFGLLMLVTLALVGMLLHSGKGLGSEQLLTWVGLFISIAALAVSLADLFPPLAPPADTAELANGLAVAMREQWVEEVDARHLRDPQVIPLSWAATARPVVAPPDTVIAAVGGRVLRLSLDGRLDGGFDTACVRLAEGYRRVNSGRLVILGEPGSGKTVLAIMLTLGLLADRAPGTPVPVLLQISGWDPLSVSLNDWMVAELARAYYGGREDVPRRLLEHRLLLAVLDGLDEMPEASRRSAVRAVNETYGEDRGMVVTCRSAEYQDVIEGGSPVLRRAPVVEVTPVSVSDAIAYLSEVSWPEEVAWEPVYEHLRTRPDEALAAALSTPLALTLARTVYSNTGRDPAELLDFGSAHAVEDHLVDHLVTAAYAPPPGSRERQAGDAWLRKAKRTEKYLTFLATYIHQQRERELHWWLMDHRLMPRLTGIVMGIPVILITALLSNLVFARSAMDTEGVAVGLVVGVIASFTWYGAPHRTPGRLSFTRHGLLGRTRKAFTTGVKLTAVIACPVSALGATIEFSDGWNLRSVTEFLSTMGVVVGGGLAMSLSLAAHALLDAPPERATGATPLGLLRQDRTSSLAGALTAGVGFAIAGGPLTILLSAATSTGISVLTRRAFSLPLSFGHIPTVHDAYYRAWGQSEPSSTTITASLLMSACLAFLILLTRPWMRFVLLRFYLSTRNRIPWRLMSFLNEARDHQLLRQSAGAYQFRHIRLQERLASRSLAQDRAPASPQRTGHRYILLGAAIVAPLFVGALTIRYTLPVDPTQVLINTGPHTIEDLGFVPGMQNTLMTVEAHRKIRLWNVQEGAEKPTRARIDNSSRRSDDIFTMAGQDGLLTIPRDSGATRARLFPWDGTRSRWIPLHVPVSALALSAGGHYALIDRTPDAETYSLQLRDMRTGKATMPACPLPASQPTSDPYFAVSGDGTRFAILDGDTSAVVVYENQCHRLSTPENVWPSADHGHIALNDDGTQLAIVDNEGASIRLYRI